MARLPSCANSRHKANSVRWLFNHLVGASEERLGDRNAKGVGGLEVDDQLELRRLLDGKVGRLGALKDLVDITSGATERAAQILAVAHKTASVGQLTKCADGWQSA